MTNGNYIIYIYCCRKLATVTNRHTVRLIVQHTPLVRCRLHMNNSTSLISSRPGFLYSCLIKVVTAKARTVA